MEQGLDAANHSTGQLLSHFREQHALFFITARQVGSINRIDFLGHQGRTYLFAIGNDCNIYFDPQFIFRCINSGRRGYRPPVRPLVINPDNDATFRRDRTDTPVLKCCAKRSASRLVPA